MVNEFWQKRRTLVICVALAAVTLAVYWPALNHPFVNYDDDEYVTANPHLKGGLTFASVKWAFTSGYACNWHPVTWLSHLLDYQFYGLEPWGHHLSNVLLHTASVVLLFLALSRMTGAVWRSAIVAALFAWHPSRVESVAWVAERKDVLSGFFFMLTIWAYQRNEECRMQNAKCQTWRWLVLVFFALGLMSKPMLVTLPFVLLLLDYWPLKRSDEWRVTSGECLPAVARSAKVGKRLLVEKLPFFALAAGACVVTFLVQEKGGSVADSYPPVIRLENAFVSYGRYLWEAIWPRDLAVFYPYPSHWPTWQILIGCLVLAGGTAAAVVWRQRRPYLLTGWFWFVGMLLPVIGIVQIGAQSMADRYTYLPLIGIFVGVVWTGADLAWKKTTAALAVVAVAGCIVGTEQQLQYWKSSEALFRHDLAVTTGNSIAWNNLGITLNDAKKYQEALVYLQMQLKTNPDAMSYYNVGITLNALGRHDDALEHFTKSVELDPGFADAHNKLGLVLNELGRSDESVEHLKKALALKPDFADAYYNLGITLTGEGKSQAAADAFSNALRFDPDNFDTQLDLANALGDAGKVEQAIAMYRKALARRPSSAAAHYDFAATLAQQGNALAAASEFRETIRLDPSQTMAHNNLGNLLMDGGMVDEAVVQFVAALKLTPDDPLIHFNYGRALAGQGKRDEAIEQFRHALRLKPDYDEARQQMEALGEKAPNSKHQGPKN